MVEFLCSSGDAEMFGGMAAYTVEDEAEMDHASHLRHQAHAGFSHIE
jgi:hypothetical protein